MIDWKSSSQVLNWSIFVRFFLGISEFFEMASFVPIVKMFFEMDLLVRFFEMASALCGRWGGFC